MLGPTVDLPRRQGGGAISDRLDLRLGTLWAEASVTMEHDRNMSANQSWHIPSLEKEVSAMGHVATFESSPIPPNSDEEGLVSQQLSLEGIQYWTDSAMCAK